ARVSSLVLSLPWMNVMGILWPRPTSASQVRRGWLTDRPPSVGLMLSQMPAARSLLSGSPSTGLAKIVPGGFLSLLRRHSLAIHIAPSVAPSPAPTRMTLDVLHDFWSFCRSR